MCGQLADVVKYEYLYEVVLSMLDYVSNVILHYITFLLRMVMPHYS